MAEDPYNPDYEYIAYVDESGETGLTNVLGVDQHGSSEWFTLSVVVIHKSEEPNLNNWVSEMLVATRSHQIKDLHFTKLPHGARIAVTKYMATKPVMCFVVCSNKKNMRHYKNPRVEAAMMPVVDWFYCWITRVALERVTHFVRRRAIERFNLPKRVKVIFSERGQLRVGQIGAYYHWISQQSRNDNLYLPWGDLEWDTMHPLLLSKDFHKNLAGLKLADTLASAFNRAFDNKAVPCNPEYAKNLMPVMARYPNNANGRYSGYGVKLLPGWKRANMTNDQKAIFFHYGYPAQLWQEGPNWRLPPPKEASDLTV
jgi:hypothetical protein